MDSVLSIFLEHMKEQTGYMKQQTEHMKEQTGYMKQQTSMNEEHMRLLTSINKYLENSSDSNLQKNIEDEDHMKKEKGGQKVTKKEEVMCDSYQVIKQLHESPAPWPLRPRTEGKKYRLHIVGEVCQPDENEPAKENVIIKGKPIPNIEVILMYGNEQVPASHHLASLRVELVVLEANYYIAGSTDWPREEFENHFFKMVSKTSAPTMTVDKAIFSLDGGRKVHSDASIKESSGKKKVRLGVMVARDGSSVHERVLEGVSSNEFLVIHGRPAVNKQIKRQKIGVSEQNTNGERVHIDTTLQPSASYSQFSGHVQSPQKIGQHATGEQPSHAPKACSTQNRPTMSIDAGNIEGAVPPQSCAPNSDQGLPALVHKSLDDNHGIPSEEDDGFKLSPPDNQGQVDLSSQNPMMVSEHVRSTQNLGQHATGGQPSHAQNAWSTQNRPTTLIDDAGNIRGTVPFPPQAYGPNSGGLPASVLQTKLQETRELLMDDSPDNQGHVDPSSQILMMGCAQNPIISSILNMVPKIVNELLPPALSISQGTNPMHKNLQGLQEQLGQFGDMLQQGRPLEVLGIIPDILLSSIRKVTSDAKILNCCDQGLELATCLSNLDGHLLSATQQQLTSTQPTRQPGNNGTGGAQGQPSTSQSNHLHTNSHGHTTTDDFTSAQMDINLMDYRDAEMGGPEQGDGGRVGDDYGGGNDGGRVGDEDDADFWNELLNNGREVYGQNSV